MSTTKDDNWFDRQLNEACLQKDKEQAQQDQEFYRRFGQGKHVIRTNRDATVMMNGKMDGSHKGETEREYPTTPSLEHFLLRWDFPKVTSQKRGTQ